MGISRSGSTAALIAAFLVAASVPADNVAPSTLAGASIHGRVISPGAAVGGTLKVTTDEKVCGLSVADDAIVTDRQGHVAHAVVTIKGLPWTGAPLGPHIVNKGCRFDPHVSIARPGATLEVTSEDPTLHTTHLYAPDKRSLFNIALPMPGIVIKRPLEKTTGVLRIACDTHPWMQGFIAVTSDRSVVTGSDGSFDIPDVPPGSHEIAVWHEVLQTPPQKVVVAAGQPTEVTITLVKR